jgi:O-antigen/teichoic acid export membrane protein
VSDAGERFDLGGQTLRERAARGTLINSAFVIGVSALGLLRGFALALFLEPSDYGVWGILLVGLGSFAWLKQVGISDRYIQQNEPDQELAFQRAFTMEAIVNIIFGVFLLVAIPVMAFIYSEPKIIAPGLALLLLLPAVTLQAPLWVLYRRLQFGRQRTLQAIDPILGFIVAVTVAAAGGGYWAWIAGAMAGGWGAAIVAVAMSPYKLAWRYSRGSARQYASFSGPLMIASIGGFVVAQGSILGTQAALGLAAVGAVTLASTVSQFSTRVDDVVSETLYPAICAVADRTELLFESFVKSNQLALMWAMPFGLGLALFASDFVHHVLGNRWTDAIVLLQAFGITAAIGHLGFNWRTYFMARGDTRPIAVQSLILAAFFLAVGMPAIFIAGLDGLAFTMIVLLFVGLAVRVVYLRRMFPGFRMGPHALRAMLPALAGVACAALIRLVSPLSADVAEAALEFGVFVAVVGFTTVVFERSLLREVIGYLTGSITTVSPDETRLR